MKESTEQLIENTFTLFSPLMELLFCILIIFAMYALYIQTKAKKIELKKLQEESEVITTAKQGKPSVHELLLPLKGRQCELVASVPLPILGFETKIRGTVVDVDSEWVMLSTETRKKETVRVLRISQFNDVHEITA